jgi:hypothetical protein
MVVMRALRTRRRIVEAERVRISVIVDAGFSVIMDGVSG